MQNKALLQGLNAAQREAVMHGEGPALVAAGPGSGKTFTITRRLLYFIQERKIPPQDFLVITFTKEAAKTMQERFQAQLSQSGLSCKDLKGFVSFATFHSYFYQIIKSIKKYSEYQLITLTEKQRIARPILQKFTEEVTDAEVNRFLIGVSFFKNTGHCKEENSYFSVKEDEEGKRVQFQKCFEQYEAQKQYYKRLDFDDMLYLCKKELLEDAGLLKYWQNRFRYVLVDEFQDCNSIQFEILYLLTKEHKNLFVVGDDDQAIYGFRGSDATIFKRFQDVFEEAVTILLVENYRCGGNIVKASRKLIEQNTERLDKQLASCKENASRGKIRVVKAKSSMECYEALALRLSRKTQEELDAEAVLFRTNTAMQMLAAQLNKKGVPFVLRERCESIYEHFLVKDIMDFFLAAQGERNRSLFLRLFQKLSYVPPREVLRTNSVDLEQLKEAFRSGFFENRRALETIEVLERHLKRLATMRLSLGIIYIRNALDYDGYLLRKAGKTKEIIKEWKQLLLWLAEDAGNYPDLNSWLMHQESYTMEVKKNRERHLEGKQGIHLLTLHASKGLEFEKVYMMNLNEGVLPQIRRGEEVTKERIEEERRLFYVGMTRAKQEVEFHYLTGTKENPRIRSRFLEQIEAEEVEESFEENKTP